jgi:PPOX class probable F420-dependent enzyme
VTRDEVIAFIRANGRAVLGTRRSDGGMQLSPVLVAVDDDQTLIISTRETALKTRNIRRDPRVYLCVMNNGFFGDWAQAEGPATVESLPGAMEGLVRYYRILSGEHDNWDEYRAAMQRDKRVLVRISVDRAGPTRGG